MTKGLDIVLQDVSSRTALSYDAPVMNGLMGWFFLGADVERSAINLAENQPDATVFGNPIVSANYLSLQGKLNFLRMNQLLPAEWTMAFVARTFTSPISGTSRCMYMGTSDLNTAGGYIYSSSSTGIAMVDYKGSSSQVTTLTTSRPHTSWSLIIASASEAENVMVNMTTGTVRTEAASLMGPLVPSVSPIGIGYGGTDAATYYGTVDIAMAAVWRRPINPTERTAIYDRLKPYYERREITI